MYVPKHISVSVNSKPSEIYKFAANPENLPKWAAGLSSATVVKSGDAWICESPMGQVKVKFAAENSFGVMDHDVTLPNGEVVHNPFRVLANGNGAEVVFTLYCMPQMTDAQFAQDAAMVQKDLETLKRILESK